MNLLARNIQIILILVMIILPNFVFAKNHEIQMLNNYNGESMVFKPGFIKINLGDEVTFVPTDSGHNSRSIFTPKDADKWKGKNNEKITISFKQEGVYIYECSNHDVMSMVGIIQVGEAYNLDEAKKFAQSYKKTLVMNKDRLDKYFEKVVHHP